MKREFLATFFGLLIGCAAFGQNAGPMPQPQPSPSPLKHEETVIVTGVFEPIPLDASERSVNSIDVQQAPLLFSTDVDFLRLDPAIDLLERAPGGIQADISIRGASLGQTLVLIDGLRVNDAQTPHHNLDLPLPLDSVSRIEVLRGAGSTFYGADAVGGAVNFITAPAPATEFRLRAGVGNFGYNEQRITGAYAGKSWSQRLTAQRNFSTGFMPDRDYRNAQLASETYFKTRLGNTKALLAGGDRPFGANGFYAPLNSWERTKSWFAGVSQEFGPNTLGEFGYRRHSDVFILLRDNPAFYENNHVSESWQAAIRRHNEVAQDATFSYGVEGYRDQIDSSNLGRHGRNRGALYGAYDLRAIHRVSLSLGVREELMSYTVPKGGLPLGETHGQFLPSVGAGYWISPNLKVRGSISRAFRAPTYTDLYYSDPANRGNPNLVPESAWSYETGADWNRGGRISMGATVFHRRMSDVIDYVFHGADDADPSLRNKYVASNIDVLHFTGIEAGVRFRQSSRSEFQLAYAAVKGSQHGLLQEGQSRYAFNYPSHNAFFAWQGTLFRQIEVRNRVGISQRNQPGNNDPYALWDLAVARQGGRIRPYLQFTNLANTSYHEVSYVPMPGRTVAGGIEIVLIGKR